MEIVVSDVRVNKNSRVFLKNVDRKKVTSSYLTEPEIVAKFMENVFSLSSKAEEYLYLICLTNKCKAINVFEVSHGTIDSALVGIREIMIRALLSGAAAIMVVHNHPSGDPLPSKEDCVVTEKIKQACEILGLKLFDHIIIGYKCYYSFADKYFT